MSRRPRAAFLLAGVLWAVLLPPPPSTGAAPAPAGRLEVTWVPAQVRQGDVLLLRVLAPAPLASLAARFAGRAVGFWPETPGNTGGTGAGAAYAGLAGVDVEDPAGPTPAVVEARTAAGEVLEAQAVIPVVRAPFPTQRLTVARPFVELDAATLARVQKERQRMEGALGTPTLHRLWAGPFRPPLENPPAPAGFGARRIINGEPRAPHTGADYAAAAGTPVLAAQAGGVVLVEEQFFAGRAVVIDHGLGLFTMYFHLQEVRVREGDAVRAGQAIGTVGSSGRATGAHLHWGARLAGARIDPTALLRVSQQ